MTTDHETDHETWRELLALRLYDELDPEEAARLAHHLAGCAACRDEAAAIERGLGSLIPREHREADEPATELPADLARRTAELAGAIDLQPAGGASAGARTWMAALVGFAAGALLVFTTGMGVPRHSPVPVPQRPVVQTTWSTSPVEVASAPVPFERSDPPPPAPTRGTLARLGALLERRGG